MLIRTSIVAILLLGTQLLTGISGALGADLTPQEQAELLHRDATRLDLDLTRREDLTTTVREAARRAARLNQGCEMTELMELRLTHSGIEVIGGYEAFIQCDDAPSPALAYYFSVNQKYLGSVGLGTR
jgi:hypothetical protein